MIFALLAALLVAGVVVGMTVRTFGGNVTLVSDWQKALRWYSNWVWGVVLLLPDAIQGAAAAGLLDSDGLTTAESWVIRGVAILGFLSRLVNQAEKPKNPFTNTP